MKTVRGFENARSILARPSGTGRFETPPALKRRIREAFGEPLTAEQVVARILADVRDRGDSAVREYTYKTGGVRIDRLEVGKRQWDAAVKKVAPGVLRALGEAAERLRDFHEVARDHTLSDFDHHGVGQMVQPLERTGLYAPGGTAAYPSTVLMTAIPARVAGVHEVLLATPPGKDGEVPAATLAAARIARVDRVFRMGGAQAIAALAYGTKTVPRVDKICGPGNIFVVLAKKMVFGEVAIDGLQGPSEVVVIADDVARPELCAAEMAAQAEHDMMASAILITTSERLAEEVERVLEGRLKRLGRRSIIAESLKANGRIVIVDDVGEAVELAALYAPEHLCLMVRNAEQWVAKIRNAGAVFAGRWSPVVMGDYVAGPSHVLPTGGTARFSSSLGVSDFLRVTSVIALERGQFIRLGAVARTLAKAEGLDAHAQAVDLRMKSDSVIASEAKQSHKAPGGMAASSRRKRR